MSSGSVAGAGESPRIRGARGRGVPRVAAWVLEEHADAIYSGGGGWGGSWGVKGGKSLPSHPEGSAAFSVVWREAGGRGRGRRGVMNR